MMLSRADEKLPALLVSYLVALPFAIGIIGKSFIFADIFMILLLSCGLFRILYAKSLSISFIDVGFLLFVGISLLGKENLTHFSAFSFELASFIFLFLGAKTITTELNSGQKLRILVAQLGKILRIMLLLSLFVFILRQAGIERMTTSFFSVHGSFKGLFNFTNQLAIFLVCLWPLAIMPLSCKPATRFMFYAVFLGVMVTTASRSGLWIAILQTLLLEFYFSRKQAGVSLLIRIISLIGILALVMSLLATDPGLQRSLGNLEHAPLSFDLPRVKNFREAFNSASDWFRGYGLGCFDQTHVHEVHNTPFSLLVETGIAGLAVFLVIFLKIASGFWRSHNDESQPQLKFALCLSWMGIFVMAMFHYLLRTRSVWLILALTLAYIRSNSEKEVADG